MKLNDLIDALAAEIELRVPQLQLCLDGLATMAVDEPGLLDTLEQYTGLAQRMGEAAELVGFTGLQAVCAHVVDNSLLVATLEPAERGPLLEFLRGWPPLIVYQLRHLSDPSGAAGLVDHLRGAPCPMDEEQALKVMHLLGAMPSLVGLPAEGSAQPLRPVLATPQDIALQLPADVDSALLEGFFHEAPEQARRLVELVRGIAAGAASADEVATAKRVAHTLKGSGSIIGLRGLATLGHHLEDVLEHVEQSDREAAARPAIDVLLDAAYCLEQMVGHVLGLEESPPNALAVLQATLDLANRIDRGESLEDAAARPPATDFAPGNPIAVTAGGAALTATTLPGAALRVDVRRIEALFRVSGEVSVQSAAMEVQIAALMGCSRELLAQNLRVQKRLFELETLVDVRGLALLRTRDRRHDPDEPGFDPLEMDRYSELHGVAHALTEEAADARTFAQALEEHIAQAGALQAQQQRLVKDLQHLVIGTRMSEVSTLESRLQRNVHATCQATGKRATLTLLGGATLIDSAVLTSLAEPLLHLLRNAVDHGLETPDERCTAGKPGAGRITLTFARHGQQVVLRCEDDGRGLDLAAIRRRAIERDLVGADQVLDEAETARLILRPGFSTRDSVSEISGRGVGLDVVHAWAAATNGSIRIHFEPGHGCCFELRFAASLSTLQALIVEAGGDRYALPSLQVEQALPRGVGGFERLGEQLVYRHAKQVYPARTLAELAGFGSVDDAALEQHDVVLVKGDEQLHALAVERLVDARELLIKSPGRYAQHMHGVAGLAILGNGRVAISLDLNALLGGSARVAPQAPARSAALTAAERPRKAVLIVDDALSVRNSLLQLVQDAGFRAESARDGLDAVERLNTFRPDIVLTDLEMPNMNGVELTRHIRGQDDLKALPVLMITSRSQDKHRLLATQAGVDAYITKPYHDAELLRAIRTAVALTGT
jgi:chemosensory pili system protein ChpA (sensor histidine kinase/response regulator)